MIDEKKLVNIFKSIRKNLDGCHQEFLDKLIEVVNDQPKVMEFISVEERLPENEIRCLVLLDNGWQQIAYYDLEEKNWMLVCDEYYLVENYYRKVVSWVPITEVLKCKEDT